MVLTSITWAAISHLCQSVSYDRQFGGGIVGSRFLILPPDQSLPGTILEIMEQSSETRAAWRPSTTMIFCGVLALTIFGWFTAILEPIYAALDAIFSITAKEQDISLLAVASDSTRTFLRIYDNVAITTRIFQIITLAGWVVYVVGLSQFRNAQVTRRGLRLSGSLNAACWLGLSAIFCGFIAGFLGMFGFLFRFIGWILMLISLFKFRSTFYELSWEDSWNKKAKTGAVSLKISYTLAIILEFYPLICGIMLFFIALGAIGNPGSIANDFVDNGMGVLVQYFAGGIGFVILLIIAGLILWICKIVYLFAGWNEIRKGSISRKILTGQQQADIIDDEDDEDEEYDNENSVVMAEPDSAGHKEEANIQETEEEEEEKEYESDNKRNWLLWGSIVGAVLIVAFIFWFCLSGNGRDKENSSTPLTEIEFSEELDESESPTSSKIKDTEDFEQSDTEDFQSNDEPVSDTGTPIYKGSINGQYAIEMTLIADGSEVTGEYRYIKNKTSMQLRGEFTDGYEHLVLEEYKGLTMTGKFEGTLANGVYDGTWTSADGEKSYPFTVVRHYRY